MAERIVKRVSIPPVSTVTVSYPDRLFETLLEVNVDVSGLARLFGNDSPAAMPGAYPLKRGLDILGSLFALLLLSPVMLIAAIAVAVSSPGPVILRQLRVGKRGIPFVFYKFRSMFCDADDRIHRELVANRIKGNLDQVNQGAATKPFYKIKSDPRVTRIGKFIRSTNIDELPQLLNVLKGEMSLVGPRPPLPYEVEKYESWHLRRVLEIRPGITGLWQVDGHNTTTFDDMVRMDLRYIRDCSLLLDLSILSRTVMVGLGRLVP